MKLKEIIIILISFIVICIGGYFLFKLLFNETPSDLLPPSNYDEALNKEDTSVYNYTYDIKVDKYDTDTFCQFDSCGKTKAIIKVESRDVQVLDVYKTKYFFYKDNGKIKVYDHSTGTTSIINVSGAADVYLFGVDEDTDEFYGVIVDDKGFRYYFSLEKNKAMYVDKYKDLYFVSKNYLSASLGETIVDEEYDYEETIQKELLLLSTKSEKIVLEKKNSDEDANLMFDKIVSGGKVFYVLESLNVDTDLYKEVYDENFKTIFKSDRESIYDLASERFVYDCKIQDGYIYVFDNGYLYKYDSKGKLVKKSNKFNNVQMLAGEYMVITNTSLLLVDIDGKEIRLGSWDGSRYLHAPISGWYEQNNKNGIYLVVEQEVSIDEVWESCKNTIDCDGIEKNELVDYNLGYEYYYIPTTKEVGRIPTYIGGYAKPVLYLYPTSKTDVTITFDKPDNLTTTYPKYKGSWEVTAYPNGDLYDKDNKYYYGLYWEEKLNHRVNFNEGFYVTKDNAIDFLEEKLSYIGLNDRERNEFIMYWLPILEKNGKNLVYFELTEERNKNSKINISPNVDSILRIAIHVKKVNSEVNIKEEKLTRFKRVGFTAVEWGGVMY